MLTGIGKHLIRDAIVSLLNKQKKLIRNAIIAFLKALPALLLLGLAVYLIMGISFSIFIK